MSVFLCRLPLHWRHAPIYFSRHQSACAGGLMDQVRSISFPRWRQPAQQQGLCIPSFSSVRTLSILRRLVFGFLASSTQHIHSSRASGVMASHSAKAVLSVVRVFCKSAGTLCTTPAAISMLDIISCQLFSWNGTSLAGPTDPFSPTRGCQPNTPQSASGERWRAGSLLPRRR